MKYEYISINILDYVISFILIAILSPLLFLIYFLVLIFDRRPVFFISSRIGKQNTKFNLYKFRTMKVKKNSNERDSITTLGKFLRRSSLDELPQLFNVLKGEMSMVGPRPVPYKKKFFFKNINFNRQSVKPGLTGLSQINFTGKKRDWDEKLKYDQKFIKNYSLFMYLLILIKTPKTLIKRFVYNRNAKTL